MNMTSTKHELLHIKTPTRCVPTTVHLLELPYGLLDARGTQPCDGGYCRRGDHMMDVEVMRMITGVKTTGFISMNTENRRWTCE